MSVHISVLMNEVIDGLLAYMDNPEITTDELMMFIKGPDCPTGGTIMGITGLRSAYETGNGSIKIRAKADIQEKKNGKKMIIITEIPYQVNKAVLVEKIAILVREKHIE